jgi:hypothetical protein
LSANAPSPLLTACTALHRRAASARPLSVDLPLAGLAADTFAAGLTDEVVSRKIRREHDLVDIHAVDGEQEKCHCAMRPRRIASSRKRDDVTTRDPARDSPR